jgi:hypothetical protein
MNEFEVTIRQYGPDDFVVTGPTLEGSSHFENPKQALSLAKHLIGARAGGGHIVRIDENGTTTRDFFQSGTHLIQYGAIQR